MNIVLAVWEKGIRPLSRVLGIVSAILCAGLALLLTLEVIFRASTGGGIRGMFEISELVLVMIAFLGFGQAESNKVHVRVSLLTDRLGAPFRLRLQGIALLLCAVFLVWMGSELAMRALESVQTGEFRTGLLNFPVWPGRTFAAVGAGLLALVMLVKGIIMIGGHEAQGGRSANSQEVPAGVI
ncbi:TRAP transporter small permease [Citricoccus nitrophenolicus]|uniref:TRAP transporter small permease n=1 Tax=Citricoccus nitrophenolicus TaxID=863575 RepID=A0ABV0IGA2_9MICC